MNITNVFKEVGGHTALHFDPKDIEDKIFNVLSNTVLLTKMKREGKERLKLFSVKTCVE